MFRPDSRARSALVLGVNGQDGSYLAESLLSRGFVVTGVARSPRYRNVTASPRFRYVQCDLRDRGRLADTIAAAAPDYAFHVAAVHGAAGFSYEALWDDLVAVNISALQSLLDHARLNNRDMRVVYASSAKVFPTPWVGMLNEDTPKKPTCLYSISKMTGRDLMTYYRQAHGIHSTNVILFNHESPRRARSFLLPQLADARLRAASDPAFQLRVRNLDFWIDWGSASEFMDIAVDIAVLSDLSEVVLASGVTWNARELATQLFERVGLDLNEHVIETDPVNNAYPTFHVDLARLRGAVGRTPKTTVFEIVDEMNATPLDVDR
jgi:GDPmannose 4,6-dehydratase